MGARVSKRSAAFIAALVVLSSSSAAVLIDSGDGKGNTTAPVPDPGWRSIGACSGLTVTYIGDGWVLSAAHVGAKPVAFDGDVYEPVAGSQVILKHEDGSDSDIAVFRIDPYPRHLLPLELRSTPVPVSEPILMVGNGHNRGEVTNWKSPDVADGFMWGKRKKMRWGTNLVTGANVDLEVFGKVTRSFYADFTPAGTRHEAHATTGDSGGPVFTRKGSRWEVAGVIYATNNFVGQPAKSTVYGNVTYAADVAYYRDQIIDVMTPDCGNGHLTIDEQCDDGNSADGDCCAADCRFEPSTTVCNDGQSCTTEDACDGAGVCAGGAVVPCDDGDPCTADSCDEVDGCRNEPVSGPGCEG